jgi:hypothetical protein
MTIDGTMAGNILDNGGARGKADALEPLEQGGGAFAQSPDGVTAGDAGLPREPGGTVLYQTAAAWDADGTLIPLGLWPGGSSSSATCISGSEFGGWGDDDMHVTHPLLFADGEITPLATLGSHGYIDGCNSSFQRVGLVDTPEALTHAALWDPDGTLDDLGTLGGTRSALGAINEGGEAVGWTTDATDVISAMRWSAATGQQALTAPAGYISCQALGLNNRGVIVGVCDPNLGYPASRAVLWPAVGGPGIDLNTFVEDSQGLTVTSARSLNDAGLIIGQASTAQNEGHGVLLAPALITTIPRLAQWFGLP